MSMKNNKHIALLLAGGKSSRMNAKRPKQYLEVGGESVLKHTMRAFQMHPLIQDIYVVCAPEWEITVREEALSGGITKFRHTVIGGDTSFQSLRNGITFLLQEEKDGDSIVLVHDAVQISIQVVRLVRIYRQDKIDFFIVSNRFIGGGKSHIAAHAGQFIVRRFHDAYDSAGLPVAGRFVDHFEIFVGIVKRKMSGKKECISVVDLKTV